MEHVAIISDRLTTIYLVNISLVREKMLFSLFNIQRTQAPVNSDMRFVARFGQDTNVVFCKAHSEVFFPHLGIRSRVLTSLWECAPGNSSSFGLSLFFRS